MPARKAARSSCTWPGRMMLFGFGTDRGQRGRQSAPWRSMPPTRSGSRWSSARAHGGRRVPACACCGLPRCCSPSHRGELAKPDWDLEWLITLPIRSDTLLWARILERSVVNPSGAIALLPVCTVIAWFSGYRWTAPIVGVLAAWPLLLLAALVRTLLDTGLRLTLRPGQLRNLHAVHLRVVHRRHVSRDFHGPQRQGRLHVGSRGLDARLACLHADGPHGSRAQRTRLSRTPLLLSAELLAQVGVIIWLGVLLLRHQLRHGVVAGGARDAARERQGEGRRGSRARGRRARLEPASSAVQRRELTLLGRDRNFLVQSLVLPLLIVGGQMLLGSSGVATSMWIDPNVLASVAFGLAAYSLSMSAFQTLNTEGHALWLLYTFPLSIEDGAQGQGEAVGRDHARLSGGDVQRRRRARAGARLEIPRRHAHRVSRHSHLRVHRGGARRVRQQPARTAAESQGEARVRLPLHVAGRASTSTPSSRRIRRSASSSWCSRCCWRSRCGRRRAISCPIFSIRMPRHRRASRRPTD